MVPRVIIVIVVLALAAVAPSRSGADTLVGFASPSGNIGCYMDSVQVRCDIRKRDWKPPKRPASCPLDYGQGLIVTGRGRGRYVCAGDTALDHQKRLGYGRTVRHGDFSCVSQRTGMRCVDVRTHHGFALSRERASLF